MDQYLEKNVDRINPGPCDGFDRFAGKRWIYPNNMAIRGYQKRAVEKSLFANSMIVLPTGFGKTFIAAVVMYNFYRWYPDGKIIFVAPTRPLVSQQIQECKKISGIPSSDCVELNGTTSREKRAQQWNIKRVFFATPQIIENDLESGILPPRKVRCIVIDEAHRAQGNYAYVGIVRQLHDANRNGFRIVALSATPGSDIERVKQVLLNLYINELVFRSENSIDLMQYKNQKVSKAWTVELTGKHKEIVDKYIEVCDPIIKTLYKAGLTYNGDRIDKVARYTLITAQTRIFNNEGNYGARKGKLRFFCGAAISLAYNFELLTLYGLRPFYSSVMNSLSETRSGFKTAVAANHNFDIILSDIRNMFKDDIKIDANKEPSVDLFQGHPKLKVVKDLLMKHFEKNEGKKETRAIVFSKYRESVYDIVQTLKSVEPIIKAGAFVGQGSGSGKNKTNNETSTSGMKQKDQIQLIRDFKDGKYNVLVATCVAEEGLDIGEVDLIICYDTSSSPISNTQRRGRTGRKRSGDVETLLTKGYEEKKLSKAGKSKRDVEDKLFDKNNYNQTRYRDSPRMVPLDITPVCLEQRIFPIDDEPIVEKPTRKRAKKTIEVEIELSDSAKKKRKCFEESDEDISFFDEDNQQKSKSVDNNNSQVNEIDAENENEVTFIENDEWPVEKKKQDSQLTGVADSLTVSQTSLLKSEDSDIEWDDEVDFTKAQLSIE